MLLAKVFSLIAGLLAYSTMLATDSRDPLPLFPRPDNCLFEIVEAGMDALRYRHLLGIPPRKLVFPDLGKVGSNTQVPSRGLVHLELEIYWEALARLEGSQDPFEIWRTLWPMDTRPETGAPNFRGRELGLYQSRIRSSAQALLRTANRSPGGAIYRIVAKDAVSPIDETASRYYVQQASERYFQFKELNAFFVALFESEAELALTELSHLNEAREDLERAHRRNASQADIDRLVAAQAERRNEFRIRCQRFLEMALEFSHYSQNASHFLTRSSLDKIEAKLVALAPSWLEIHGFKVQKDVATSSHTGFLVTPPSGQALDSFLKRLKRYRSNLPPRLLFVPKQALWTQVLLDDLSGMGLTLPMLVHLEPDLVDSSHQLRTVQIERLRERARPIASFFQGWFQHRSDEKKAILSTPLAILSWLPAVIEEISYRLKQTEDVNLRISLTRELLRSMNQTTNGDFEAYLGLTRFAQTQALIENDIRSNGGDLAHWTLSSVAERRTDGLPMLVIHREAGENLMAWFLILTRTNVPSREMEVSLSVGDMILRVQPVKGTDIYRLAEKILSTVEMGTDKQVLTLEQRELTWLFLRKLGTQIEDLNLVALENRERYERIDALAYRYLQDRSESTFRLLLTELESFEEHPIEKVTLRTSAKQLPELPQEVFAYSEANTPPPLKYFIDELRLVSKGSSQWNSLIEQTAVDILVRHVMSLGYRVHDESRNNLGYDLLLYKGNRTLAAEVKGISKLNGTVTLTRDEILYAQQNSESWFLALVYVDAQEGTTRAFYLRSCYLGPPLTGAEQSRTYSIPNLLAQHFILDQAQVRPALD